MNNAITEIKSTLEGTNSRITEAEDRISEVEDRMLEINEAERKKEKRMKRNEDNLRDLWDNVKHPNIRIIEVPEEEDKKKGHEKILEEIIVENFPKMQKEIATQVQETQRVPNRINPRLNTPRHILIKLMKIKHKEQILKAAREKQQTTHKGIPIRITVDLSIETLQARREWQDILKVMKEKNLQPRLLYPARISFKYEGEIKSFQFSSVQSFSRVHLFATQWTAAHQASLSITNSWSLPKLMSIESVMPSNHLILCCPLLLPPSIFPSTRVFSNESALLIRWPKYWSFSFNISPSNEYSGLISFRIDWLDLLAVQGTLKSLLQHHSSKASILWCSAFFIVQLSHPYMTTGKIIALTRWTFVGKVMSKAEEAEKIKIAPFFSPLLC